MQEKSSFAAGFVFRRKGQGESNKAKGIDFKGIENDILIEIRLKKAIEYATLYLFPFTLSLFGTDFIKWNENMEFLNRLYYMEIIREMGIRREEIRV